MRGRDGASALPSLRSDRRCVRSVRRFRGRRQVGRRRMRPGQILDEPEPVHGKENSVLKHTEEKETSDRYEGPFEILVRANSEGMTDRKQTGIRKVIGIETHRGATLRTKVHRRVMQ